MYVSGMTLRPASEFIHASSRGAAAIAEGALWWEASKQWAVERDSGAPLYYEDRLIIGDTVEEVRKQCEAIGIDLETVTIDRAPEVESC